MGDAGAGPLVAREPGVVPACVFCEIVAGTRPAHVVVDDGEVMAFLDTRPLFKGHTLVVPRPHHETIGDLPAEAISAVFGWARLVAMAMESALGAAGSFVALNNRVSQSVPHLHVHVVPRRPKDGLRGFFWPRTRYDDDEEAASYASRLRSALS